MATEKSGAAVQETPDALGKEGRVQTVLAMLRNIQTQAFSLQVESTANALDDAAPAPQAPHRSVAEHREFLKAAENRLLTDYADLLPDIRRSLS